VDDVDLGDCSFALLDENGATVNAGEGTVRMCRRHTGRLYLCDIDTQACSFGLKAHPDAQPLDLTLYNGEGGALLTARITRPHAIYAEWVTPISDLGSPEYSKRLLGMTVVAKAKEGGEMRFGYESRFGLSMEQAYGSTDGFSFSDFSFRDFTFDTGFATSYSVRLMERNVNFVAMRICSDTERPCAIERLSMQYEINKRNKGVR
jgi:hypothetical protein